MKRESNNICNIFISAANANPDKMAFITPRSRITYGQLAKDVIAAASTFTKKNIAKGDFVLLLMPVGIDLYRTVLALFYIGAVPVFLDDTVTLKTVGRRLEKVACKAVLSSFKWRLLFPFIKSLKKIPIKVSPAFQPHQNDAVPLLQDVSPNDTALITFTTGSTGSAKAANRTHGFLKAQLQALQPHLQSCGDVVACTLPVVMLLNLAEARTSVIGKVRVGKTNRHQHGQYVDFLEKNNVSGLIVSPSIALQIARYLLFSQRRLPAVQQLVTGGGPVWPEDASTITNAFQNVVCTIVFGSTEAEPVSSISAAELSVAMPDQIQSSGLPVGLFDAAAEVKILRLNSTLAHHCSQQELLQACCKVGETGEIIVAGKHVLSGYVNDKKAFIETKIMVAGKLWHRTGDAGQVDNFNHLFLKGRVSRIIDLAGKKWYPFLIEHACLQIESIECGSLLLLNSEPYFVFQVKHNCKAPGKFELQSKLALKDVSLLRVEKIPFDLRHNSKIDYAKLETVCLKKMDRR